jgi:hypothetical protein
MRLPSRLSSSLLVVCALSACDRPPSDRVARRATPTTAAPAAPAASPLAGSQEQLADDLDAAARELTFDGGAALRQRWQGKAVRWTVTRVPALCGGATSCFVQPFANARRSETSAQGWLPRVHFAAGEYERLEATCGGAAVCSVTLEGTIEQLQVSDELPTSIVLGGVRVRGRG